METLSSMSHGPVRGRTGALRARTGLLPRSGCAGTHLRVVGSLHAKDNVAVERSPASTGERPSTFFAGLFLLDMNEFNADVIAQHEQWSRAAVEEKFVTTLAAFERFLTELPETALENERIQTWIRIDAIDHYEAHRPPN